MSQAASDAFIARQRKRESLQAQSKKLLAEIEARPRPPATEADLWARLFGVPNRLYGTTINSEGDAI